MSNQRSLSWSAALLDIKADRYTPPPVREERIRLPSAGQPLAAWRGRSSTRYICSIAPLHRDQLADHPHGYVALAVARAEDGTSRLVAVAESEKHPTPSTAAYWIASAQEQGANELHIHRLAKGARAQAGVAADLAV